MIKKFLMQTPPYYLYKKCVGRLAAAMHGFPSREMIVIGVTGTDGKSTTVNLIHHIFNETKGKSAMVSTIHHKIGQLTLPNTKKMTSLDPFDLQRFLQQAKNQGCLYVVIEVASHGIDQYRFEGVHFDMAVLTNITSDHLDWHKTLENYVATKKKLFMRVVSQTKRTSHAVFPKDDVYGRKWYQEMGFDKSIDYSVAGSAGLKATNITEELTRTSCTIEYLGESFVLSLPLIGSFNVQNALASIGAGILMGIPIDKMVAVLATFMPLPGRMQRFVAHERVIFVDYAHTTNGLKSVLSSVGRIQRDGRLIHVVGAPGQRDVSKRKQMGQLADRYADIVILTDDDPAGENRYSIIFQVADGIDRVVGDTFFIQPTRSYAVQLARQLSLPGDVIVITGKGHEAVQLTNFGKNVYSDVVEVQQQIDATDRE